MVRFSLYAALFGVALLIALFTTLYGLRYDRHAPSSTLLDLQPPKQTSARVPREGS